MKRCPNPDCRSGVLLRRHQDPLPLLPQRSGAGYGTCRLSPGEPAAFAPCQPAAGTGRNQCSCSTAGGGITCTGRVLELDHQAVFYSRAHKLFNALVRGEPYQFAHQTLEYTVRVEPITDRVPSEVTDFCLYGNCRGASRSATKCVSGRRSRAAAGW